MRASKNQKPTCAVAIAEERREKVWPKLPRQTVQRAGNLVSVRRKRSGTATCPAAIRTRRFGMKRASDRLPNIPAGIRHLRVVCSRDGRVDGASRVYCRIASAILDEG